MPVLKDMTKLYVGAAPLEKVYAGTNLVWQKDRDFEVVQYLDIRSSPNNWCFSWSYNFDPFTCEEAGKLFSIRYEDVAGGSWSPWTPFNNKHENFTATWLSKPDDRLVWCNTDPNFSLAGNVGAKYQVRLTEGGKTIIKEISKEYLVGVGPNAPASWFQTQCV